MEEKDLINIVNSEEERIKLLKIVQILKEIPISNVFSKILYPIICYS